MKFNKSTIATVISASLASVALNAGASNISQGYKTLSTNLAANSQMQVAQAKTASGMSNQFDSSLGKTTFQWAGTDAIKPDLGPVAAQHRTSVAADFYLNKLTGHSASKGDGSQAVLANVHDLGRGALIAKYKQEIAGVEIFNREYNIMMDREHNLVASSGYFANAESARGATPSYKNAESQFGQSSTAISAAYEAMGGDKSALRYESENVKGKFTEHRVATTSDVIVLGEPRAKKVFFDVKGKLEAAHYVEIETTTIDSVDSEYKSYVISAASGKVLFTNNLKSHSAAEFNYRIYADSDGKPWDSPHGNVIPAGPDTPSYLDAEYKDAPLVTLAHGAISTKDAWLEDGVMETKGNNVTAYVDAIAPQGLTNGDYTAEITSANTFDYAYDPMQPEYSTHNRKAAIVNLFYMSNFLHDDFYDHGFDEAAGNAQALNYGRGGEEGDALNVEVQDNSGFNNANMSTPSDGYPPRMQMYLFDKNSAKNGEDWGLTVTSPSDIGLLETTLVAGFGPQSFDTLTGKLVAIDDGVDIGNDGCTAAANAADLAGNIAVIDRGECAFVDKVNNAQDAGAIAVIVANNKDGDAVIRMSGEDADIVTPAVMISQNEGAAIYTAMASGDVEVSMFANEVPRAFKGSTWDNGIVAHEWGHYISNRLVGNSSGLSNQQGRSMGEGWGDFHALLLLSGEDDSLMVGNEMFGTAYSATSYVANFQTGIRNYPYSSNMDINPLTFANVTLGNGTRPDRNGNAEVHDAGEPWAVMLWDSYVGLINDERHTFEEAQSLMKDYLVAGYKMTPMAPTYTEARDAILAAAYANDEEDYKVILGAFARRGMGLGAVSPDRSSTDHLGVVESYKTELATFSVSDYDLDENYAGLTSGYCTNDNILDKGETGTASFTISNRGSEMLSGITGKVEVVSGQQVTFANDGMISFDDVGLFSEVASAPIEFTLDEAATADELVFKVTFPDLPEGTVADEFMVSTTVNMAFEARELNVTTQTQNMNTLSALNDFAENVMIGGDAAMGTASLAEWGYDDGTDKFLWIKDNGFRTDIGYETKTMTVGFDGDFQITWYHNYLIESSWDGGVVEVSVNGGDWADVTEMGGQFVEAGYTGTILDEAETALSGKDAFTGANSGWESVTFGESLNGNEVKFRFRMVSDGAVGARGWIIDDITFDNSQTSIFSDVVAGDSIACDNRLPHVSIVGPTSSLQGTSVTLTSTAIDANNDALTYSWEQTAGTAATVTGADTEQLSVTLPSVTRSEVLTFALTVSDGTGSVTENFEVNVEKGPYVKAEKQSSDSGSTGLLSLLLLPLIWLRRRK